MANNSSCPWCGCENFHSRNYQNDEAGKFFYYMVCNKCNAHAPEKGSEAEAIKAWNNSLTASLAIRCAWLRSMLAFAIDQIKADKHLIYGDEVDISMETASETDWKEFLQAEKYEAHMKK